mgnify:CR=1 FL=1
MQKMAKFALKKCSFWQKLHFYGAILVIFLGRDAFWEHSEWLDSERGLRKLYKSCLCDYLVMIEKIP